MTDSSALEIVTATDPQPAEPAEELEPGAGGTPPPLPEAEPFHYVPLRIVDDNPALPSRFAGYHVHLEIFEGPMDLLLHLIRQNEVDIYDIPVAEIADQYLEYIHLMGELNIEVAGEFLVMASTLLLIKSKMLLPPDPDDEEEEAADPRAELVRRLLEYQQFKEAARGLDDMTAQRARMYARIKTPEERAADQPEPIVCLVPLFELLNIFREALERVGDAKLATIRREKITVTEAIRTIVHRLRHAPQGMTFRALCDTCETRIELVVTFLALLELVRRWRIKVYQQSICGDIWIMEREADESSSADSSDSAADADNPVPTDADAAV